MASLVVDADYTAGADNGGSKHSGAGGVYSGDPYVDSNDPEKCALRFDLSSLPVGSTVSQVDLQCENTNATDGSASHRLGPYGGDGQSDPEADNAATLFSRCDLSSDNYITGRTEFRTTGSKTFSNLGSAANTDVAANTAARHNRAHNIDSSSDHNAGVEMVQFGSRSRQLCYGIHPWRLKR